MRDWSFESFLIEVSQWDGMSVCLSVCRSWQSVQGGLRREIGYGLWWTPFTLVVQMRLVIRTQKVKSSGYSRSAENYMNHDEGPRVSQWCSQHNTQSTWLCAINWRARNHKQSFVDIQCLMIGNCLLFRRYSSSSSSCDLPPGYLQHWAKGLLDDVNTAALTLPQFVLGPTTVRCPRWPAGNAMKSIFHQIFHFPSRIARSPERDESRSSQTHHKLACFYDPWPLQWQSSSGWGSFTFGKLIP